MAKARIARQEKHTSPTAKPSAKQRNKVQEQPLHLLALQDHLGNAAVQRLLQQDNSLALSNLVQQQRSRRQKPKVNTGTVTIREPQQDLYPVTGSTLADVFKRLDPEEWGRCTYSFDYSYKAVNGRTTQVDIVLGLLIRLPSWQGDGWEAASLPAKAEWQRMITALTTHEEKHAAIARQFAPVFKKRLLHLDESTIDELFESTKAEVDQAQKQYDKKTQHGRAEGVNLDLSIK